MSSTFHTLKAAASGGGTAGAAAAATSGLKIDNFTATASQTAFVLSWSPPTVGELLVLVDGTRINMGYTVTVTGSTLNISPGLDAAMVLTVVGATGVTTRNDLSGAMTHPTLLGTGDGVTVDFPIPTQGDEEIIWLGGALQIRGTDYTVVTASGVKNARFTVAPDTGIKVHGSSAITLLPGTDALTLNGYGSARYNDANLGTGSLGEKYVTVDPATGQFPQAVDPAAQRLDTTGAAVDISAAAPPTTGQLLTATGATTATWQTPAAADLLNSSLFWYLGGS